ncbi:MAG: YigZ family protein, partial [Clostridia bacterium]|nr:YigZ family protein [Clostridia bacterium]
SDDSEPHGTAGKPVFDVINGNNLENVIVIVTRYFGGVLLGTGGLVRAYSTAARDAINKAQKITMCLCSHMSVECDYADYSILLTLIENACASVKNTEFTDKITVDFCLKNEDVEAFCQKLTETFSSRLEAKKTKEDYFSFKTEEF